MRRLLIFAAPLALLAGFATACGGGDDSSSGDAAASDTETTAEALPATPSGSGASADDALAPGAEALSGNGYSYKLVSITPDATEAILAENEFNDPPAEGDQFMVIRLEATRTADATALFGPESALRLEAPDGTEYTTFGNSCGVIPDLYTETPELAVDESREGDICFAVPSDQAPELIMYEDTTGQPQNYRRLS